MVRPLTVLVVALITAAVCIRLGIWQLDRLEQRRTRNALLEERRAMPPVELGRYPVHDSLRFRRAEARGTFDFQRQIVVMARSQSGVPGVNVVTPLLLDDASAVLVERGWVPSPDARSVDLEALAEPDTSWVVGLLIAVEEPSDPGDGWPLYVRYANPPALQARYPYALVPFVLRRLEKAAAAPLGLREIPILQLTNGPHLSYAVQWFSFAVIAIVGSLLFVRSSRGAVND